MSLPTALKHLLAQRSPNAVASPGLGKLSSILNRSLVEARQRHAERGWLCVSTATLLTLNSPDAVGDLYKFSSKTPFSIRVARSPNAETESLLGREERTAKAALMREAALKCAVFVGVPKVINSLAGLTASLESDVKKSLSTTPTRIEDNDRIGAHRVAERGSQLFASVYDPHTEKLLKKLGSYHPDFPGFIVHNEYGALLSDPAHELWPIEGRVGRALTSATGVACLRASGGVGPQLTSHVYGLIKARGYEKDARAAGIGAGEEWLASPEGATWVLGVVDQLVDTLRESDTNTS